MSLGGIGTDSAGALELAAWLGGAPLARVTELRQVAASDSGRAGAEDVGRAVRLAGIVAAHHRYSRSGQPLLIGWCRHEPGGPISVATSTTDGPPPGSGPGPLSFPPGAHGHGLTVGQAARLFASMPAWTRLAGVADALVAAGPFHPEPARAARPSLEDCLLDAWQGPFAWLLRAEPLSAQEVAQEADRTAALERDARTRGSSPDYAVRVERLARRHHELRAGESTGVWRVHILVGGADLNAAASLAALLIASADLAGLPYALAPTGTVADLRTILADLTPEPGGHETAASPFVASSAMVAVLARPPTVEIPGVRLTVRPGFDVTPETGPGGGSGIGAGQVLDRAGMPAGELLVPFDSLNRHTFVCGATGAGKSQTIRHLLEQAATAGIPWLVIEPAKAEYRRMTSRMPGTSVAVIRPGDPDSPPIGINPLEPAAGFPLQTHADLVRALFTAAFQAEEPFPQVLAAALTRTYTQLGWDLVLGEPSNPAVTPRYPTLGDLQRTAEQVVQEIGYGKEVTENVRGFIRVRLASLRLGTTGRFFDGGLPLDMDQTLTRNVVVEIEDVGDDRDKAFLIGAVLIRLTEHLRVRDRRRPHPGGLRHLTVVEEAHRLLRRPEQPGPAAHAVELFAALLAEVRAYGEGLILAEQIPAKLIPDAIKNTAVKIVHRLPARDDRDTVGATMNLTDDQSRYLVTLPPGTGAVFTDGMDYPVLVRVPDGTAREQAPAKPAWGTDLARKRAAGCGGSCEERPCTVRQITTAQRLAVEEPRLVVWVELAVLAHLVGMPLIRPPLPFASTLNRLDSRLRDCAIRQTVEAAVTARSMPLALSHSPAAFTAHVAADLRAQLAGATACPDHPRSWLASQFRWNLIRLALQDLHRRDPGAGRHPDSERWEEDYQQPVPGDTCAAQLETVASWCRQLLQDDVSTVDRLLFGDPARLEQAVGASRQSPRWQAALSQRLDELGVADAWPQAFLTRPSAGSSDG
jgi:hypothetical protein